MNVLVLYGPNLNLLGEREPEIYGHIKLKYISAALRKLAKQKGVSVRFKQSNHEGILIDCLHANRRWADGLLLNLGAYTHTSIALRDAILAIQKPFVEVHLSDLTRRESFRQVNYFSDLALATFMGEKEKSFYEGFEFLVHRLKSSDL